MTKKMKVTLILAVAFSAAVFTLSWLFVDEVEIHTLRPVSVNLNEGWPGDAANPVIGMLPQGVTIAATPIVHQDHMVYRIEYEFSPGKKQVGYVMFTGYCQKDLIETHIRHHFFQQSESIGPDCSRPNTNAKPDATATHPADTAPAMTLPARSASSSVNSIPDKANDART